MEQSRHRSITNLLLIAAMLFGLVAGLSARPEPVQASPIEAPAAQTDPGSLELKCHLEPVSWVNAGFSMPGRIEQLQVGTGDRVQAGQALAELSNPEQFQAAIAAAELGVVLAQNNLNSLHDLANHQLALAEQALADANKAVETATWQAASAKQPYSKQSIAQAYANQMLAKKQLDQLRKDQAKVEKLLSDPTSFIWRYVKRKLVKEQALFLQSAVANADAKYQDAVQKYEDRLKPPDPIDVAKAEANLAAAHALADKARLDRDRLMNGPDPDELARLEAERLAAQGKLEVAQSALDATQLSAPIAGQVAEVQVKAGEWASPGQTVLVIADFDHWIVQCDELTQDEIVALQPDQSVQVTLDALPELSLAGTVTQIGLTYRDIRDESRFQAKIALDEAPPGLRWGMTSRITIPSAQ